MRTTLEIDDDVLTAARALAQQQRRSVGDVMSALARKALERPMAKRERNGVPLLPDRPGVVVSLEVVNRLRDEAP